MQSDATKRLDDLTEQLTDFPDSEAPPIPEEWLKASRGQNETEVCDE
ncbi:MAG: hypothetical protein WCS52_04985 [bacterium]